MPTIEEERKHKHHHPNVHEMAPHVHIYITEANVADDHQHIIMGVSGPSKDKGRCHLHRIHGRTSFICEEGEGGHWHTQDVMTGPEIDMPDGSHVHFFEGMTSKDDDHCHSFSGATGLGPCCEMISEDECEEDFEDECPEEIEDPCEEVCEMPMMKNLPKYKFKYGKRPEDEK